MTLMQKFYSNELIYGLPSDAVSELYYTGARTFPVGHFLQANISWTGR